MRNAVACLTVVWLVGMTSSNAETLTQRMRMAQQQTFNQCMQACDDRAIACMAACRGTPNAPPSCVANCGTQETACKTGCQNIR
jgi:hypothetical protein